MRRRRLLILTVMAGSLAAVGVAHVMKVARGDWLDVFQQTAQAPQPAVGPAAPEVVVAEGRVVTYPGAEVTVGAEVAGRIARVAVQEGQAVHQGEVLAELASDEEQAELSEAQSRLGEIDADIKLFEWELQSYGRLTGMHAISEQKFAERQHDLNVARAQREGAAAAVTRLKAKLAKLTICSPIDGTATVRFVEPGQITSPGAPMFTIADLARTRIEAEVNEFDVARIVPGSRATVSAEGYPDLTWRAKVEEIPVTVVGRHLRPQDPGRPVDTGVLLVKLNLLDPTPLKLGQRVEVRLH